MVDDARLPEKELLALAVDFLSSKGLNEPVDFHVEVSHH